MADGTVPDSLALAATAAPTMCNALAPICGERCTLPVGHEREHQFWENGRRWSGWYGDYSNDPGATASTQRQSKE